MYLLVAIAVAVAVVRKTQSRNVSSRSIHNPLSYLSGRSSRKAASVGDDEEPRPLLPSCTRVFLGCLGCLLYAGRGNAADALIGRLVDPWGQLRPRQISALYIANISCVNAKHLPFCNYTALYCIIDVIYPTTLSILHFSRDF